MEIPKWPRNYRGHWENQKTSKRVLLTVAIVLLGLVAFIVKATEPAVQKYSDLAIETALTLRLVSNCRSGKPGASWGRLT